MKVLSDSSGNSLESIESAAFFCVASGTLWRPGKAVRLEPRAACVLAALIAEADQVVSRQSLLDGCWGEGLGSDEALTQAVSQIRKAATSLGLADPIRTYAKRGYAVAGVAIQPARRSSAGSVPSAPTLRAGPIVSRRQVALLGLVAALILVWLLMPHGPRHWVRHSLGLHKSGSASAGH